MLIKNIISRHLWFRIVPLTLLALVVKMFFHAWGWEFLELSTLFTAIISANVFLLGFLLAGVLTDFKESERLPGEVSVSLEALIDESLSLYKAKRLDAAKDCLLYTSDFIGKLKNWFHKDERTHVMMAAIRGYSDYFLKFEPHTQANFIVRLKQEQSALRRSISRIDTIRDTSFVSSAYRIAELNSMLLVAGLLVLDVAPFSNALYFTGIITFLFGYMLALIRDLDNPFGFYEDGAYENVALKLLLDTEKRLNHEIKNLG